MPSAFHTSVKLLCLALDVLNLETALGGLRLSTQSTYKFCWSHQLHQLKTLVFPFQLNHHIADKNEIT